jgi:hypothetical protein
VSRQVTSRTMTAGAITMALHGSHRRPHRGGQQAYACPMLDEVELDLRRTQLLAVDASLTDARRALLRAARINSAFATEIRALLAAVADLDRRVLADADG